MLTPRDFLGEEYYKFAVQDYESLCRFRNEVSARRPTPEEVIILKINKPWIAFYKSILNRKDG